MMFVLMELQGCTMKKKRGQYQTEQVQDADKMCCYMIPVVKAVPQIA